jgi:hypothetical protein
MPCSRSSSRCSLRFGKPFELGQHCKPRSLHGVVVPVLVPKGLLWQADYDANGRLVVDARAVNWATCYVDLGTPGRLRCVPIESIDFLDAGVADQQWRFVRSEAAPVSEGSSGRLKPLQAEDALQFVV